MRRIVTVAISTGLTLAGLGVPYAGASPKGWETGGAYRAVKAGGTYARGSGKVTISGWLQDDKENGWAAAVQFRATEGDGRHTSEVYFFLSRDIPADLRYHQNYGTFFSSDYTKHLYARECGVTPDRKRTTTCADWQQIY